VKAPSVAAQAAAASTAMPGDLEDLSGGTSIPVEVPLPDKAELERLRAEVARRVADMSKSMAAARDAAAELADKAKGATARGAGDEAAQLERKADAERARMHSMLAELATLESELKELERALDKIGDLPPPQPGATSGGPSAPRRPAPAPSIDDQLEQLKRAGGAAPRGPAQKPSSTTRAKPADGTVDDELAALKKKMAQSPPKKKP